MAAREYTGAETKRPRGRRQAVSTVQAAVRDAVAQGYVIGREVMLGAVPGTVIGFNIARCGDYRGSRYPLLVRTAYGVTKCGIDELSIA